MRKVEKLRDIVESRLQHSRSWRFNDLFGDPL